MAGGGLAMSLMKGLVRRVATAAWLIPSSTESSKWRPQALGLGRFIKSGGFRSGAFGKQVGMARLAAAGKPPRCRLSWLVPLSETIALHGRLWGSLRRARDSEGLEVPFKGSGSGPRWATRAMPTRGRTLWQKQYRVQTGY